MLKDTGAYNGKNVLNYSVRCLYHYSVAIKDTAVTRDAERRMLELHIH